MAAADGHSDRMELRERNAKSSTLWSAGAAAGTATGTPKKLSATNVVELIRIIRALEATMSRHIEALSKASTATAAGAAAGPAEQAVATGSGADGSVGDGTEIGRSPASQTTIRKTLSKPRRSSSRLNGVVADGLTSTKVVKRSDKVCIVTPECHVCNMPAGLTPVREIAPRGISRWPVLG